MGNINDVSRAITYFQEFSKSTLEQLKNKLDTAKTNLSKSTAPKNLAELNKILDLVRECQNVVNNRIVPRLIDYKRTLEQQQYSNK